ncbi:MAG: molybdopterin-guanine dinucleotide biosynthesis protein B [Solidesulfovibrio sp.]
MHPIPIVCIVAAQSKTGKTTLMEKLIGEIVGSGYRVGAVKSDCHGFSMDVRGKDSWRFAQAGADAVAVVGPERYAVIQRTDEKQTLDAVTSMMREVDIILAEGFKQARKPKIEVLRRARGETRVVSDEDVFALVTDATDISSSAPVFGLNEYKAIAAFVMDRFLRASA